MCREPAYPHSPAEYWALYFLPFLVQDLEQTFIHFLPYFAVLMLMKSSGERQEQFRVPLQHALFVEGISFQADDGLGGVGGIIPIL